MRFDSASFFVKTMMIFPLEKDDQYLIWEFLRIAAHEDSLPAVQSAPLLSRYAKDWGRHGDFGFAAREGNGFLGVIWARTFPASEPGFGFLGAEIPEISLAVLPGFRGRGIGRALLQKMKQSAASRCQSLSLSVRDDNLAAIRLYEGCGFEKIAGSEIGNRSGGVSFVMRLDF